MPASEATTGRLMMVFVSSGACSFALLAALYAGGAALARERYYAELEEQPCLAAQLARDDALALAHASRPIQQSMRLVGSARAGTAAKHADKPPISGWVRAPAFEQRVHEADVWSARHPSTQGARP